MKLVTLVCALLLAMPLTVHAGRLAHREHHKNNKKSTVFSNLLKIGAGAACIAGAILTYEKFNESYATAKVTTQPQGLDYFKKLSNITALSKVSNAGVQTTLKAYGKVLGWGASMLLLGASGVHHIAQGTRLIN